MTKLYEPKDLEQLGKEALFYITDHLNPGNPETPGLIIDYQKRSEQKNIRHRYCFGECNYFAAVTHLILNCPIVEVTFKGSDYHTLVEIDGQLMDIEGFVTKESLENRYDISKIKIDKAKYRTKDSVEVLLLANDKEEIIKDVIDAIYHLKPGVFKQAANLKKAIKFMNDFYQENEPTQIIKKNKLK